MNSMFKERVWLSKAEAKMIEMYMHINYLWEPQEVTQFDISDIVQIQNITKALNECIVAFELNQALFPYVKNLVDLEIEGPFFKDMCGEDIFNEIESKVDKFETINRKQNGRTE